MLERGEENFGKSKFLILIYLGRKECVRKANFEDEFEWKCE